MKKQVTKNLVAVLKMALKKRVFLVLCLIVLLISTLAIFANRWNSSKIITNLSVSGNRIVAEKEILGQLDTPILFNSKNKINLLQIRREVVSHPYIKSSYVTNNNSNEISIEVQERIPFAIVVTDDGNLFYTDEDASCLPYRLSDHISDLPLIRGVVHNGKIDTVALRSSIKIIVELRKPENKELYNIASEVIYYPEQRTFYLMAEDAGIKILFGEIGNLKDKFELLSGFWKERVTKNKTTKIEYVDLRWNKQLVAMESNKNK